MRFLPGHNSRLRAPNPYRIEDRGHETPCWVWTSAVQGNGYGRLTREGKVLLAHRYVYEQHRGPIPDGLQLDHLCRVRLCVNPEHLEPVTQLENLRRGAGTRLTPDQVRAIRRSAGTQASIAERFGIAQSHVSNIKRGMRWGRMDTSRVAI